MNQLDPRGLSKSVFGNSYMLEVCTRIAAHSESRLTLTGLLAADSISPSLFVSPIERLAAAGLLIDEGRDPTDHRRHWYRRADTLLWNAAVELANTSADQP
ncbi:MAG: hypothetical protein WD942_04820 [Dehalococcoidia bacterium]